MRRCLSNVLFAAVIVTFSAPAFAQECPPGAWFCEESSPPVPTPEAADPEPDEEAVPTPPPPPVIHRHRRPHIRFATPPPPPRPPAAPPPPVVVYQPPQVGAPPAQVVIVAPGVRRPPPPAKVTVIRTVEEAPAPAKPRRWHRRWGLNMRVEGAALGHDNGGSEDAGMGGLGLSLRFRPVPAFAFDAGIDVLSGTDWNGDQRTEMPISLSGILFVNPKSRVQFYLLGGAHFAHAEVESDSFEPLRGDRWDEGNTRDYSYFGGHGGIGLEFRISRLIALNVDVLGFVRKRTDDGGPAEFTDPETGRTTNTSGGGLLRGGLTFWW